METIEYLFTGFIIIAILVGSSTMVTMLSEPHRVTSEKEHLKVIAQKITTQLILDPGMPLDWGSIMELEVEEITALGLAKHSETRRDAYNLDPDKVLRLDSSIKPKRLYIPPSRALELLNLKGEYGFKIELQPVLNIAFHKNETNNKYEINVSTISGTPIAGANVTARMYYFKEEEGFAFADPKDGPQTTNVYGNCEFDFNVSSPRSVILLAVEQNGSRMVKMFKAGDQVGRALILGNCTLTEKALGGEAMEILLEAGDNQLDIINVYHNLTLKKVEEGIYIYELGFLEPSLEAVLAISEDSSTLYYASNEMTLSQYSTVEGAGPTPLSYSLERSVRIGRSIYILRLYVWRMVW